MTFFEPEHLRQVTGGRWRQAPSHGMTVHGVGIDTRKPLAGQMFFAIHGEHHDGHDYLHEAVAADAGLLVVEGTTAPTALPAGVGVLEVTDTRQALMQLATAYRQTLTETTVIAVTGSAGKTTTKMLLHGVLSTAMQGSAAPKSFNNAIGVPLTLLAADPGDRYVVVEVGSNAPGETAMLTRIVEPDIAVITTIGRAHLSGFGSVGQVALEKSALVQGLSRSANRLAVVNGDVAHLSEHVASVTPLVRFGRIPGAQLRLTARGSVGGRGEGGGAGWWFEINDRDRFRLGLPGAHNALNAIATVAVARHLGVGDVQIDEALACSEPVAMRMSRSEVGGVVVYNDAYNANPDSAVAALDAFAELSAGSARRVLVLGDMLELGEDAVELHGEVAEAVVDLDRRLPIDHVVLIGPLWAAAAMPIRRVFGATRMTVLPELTDQTADDVAALLQPGDAVLLKASRAIGLERIITALEQRQDLRTAETVTI